MPAARIHHYVPRCYLKNFCPNGSGQIFVVDAILKKPFRTSISNIAAQRDFNRVDIEGVAPDAVEAAYGLFEADLGPALERIISNRSFLNEKDRTYVLNLIGLTAVRNPRLRSTFAQFKKDTSTRRMDLALSSRENWESLVQRAKAAGEMENVADIDYEEIKKGWDGGGYQIEISNNFFVRNEAKVFDGILPFLFQRKWTLLHASAESGGFITSDHPMCLVWSNPKDSGIYSPGLGVRGTDLLFPLSPELALMGRFEGEEVEKSADLIAVGNFNGIVLGLAERQVYARDNSFACVRGFPQPIRRGAEILDDPYFVRPRANIE